MPEDPGAELERGEERRRRRGTVRLGRSIGLAKIGGEALVDTLATLMPSLDWNTVAKEAQRTVEDDTLDSWIQARAVDSLARLQAACAQEMAAARTVAQCSPGSVPST
ncbi:hypothetical protein ACH4TQ_49690 [Streptomyces sp. NPDC021218]|uniref:hypothetical protein n=1 Tax=Streptomyces sp. NPDC021218 TaxID=3365119 RepID=UPI003793763A